MLVTRAAVQPGEDVLIHAAGSGVGSIGIQIAKLRGARVIATAGSEEKLAKARALGADETVDYTRAIGRKRCGG
jgi:NADPH:quinone reductase-like Zn-dependent oxidoreductase